MPIIAHAPTAVNARNFSDASLEPGSVARILATGKPLYDVIHAEYLRRRAIREADAVVCEYEPSALDLALLHGGDHDAQPGDPDDLHVWSMTNDDYFQAECELAEWVAEREASIRESEGWPMCYA